MNPDLARRLKPTGRLLIRSAIEIGQLLEEMRASAAPVTAQVDRDQVLFLSRLLEIDAAGGHVLVACCEHRPANLALLELPEVTLSCNHGGAHFEFAAAAPRATDYGGVPAVQLNFPAAVLVLQRRAQPRYIVPPGLPLRCEIELGALSFDARVVDISLNGIGAIVFDAGIRLERGTRLPRTRLRHPGIRPVAVELEVLRVGTVVADGRPAKRAGCRFIGAATELERVIRLFVTELK